MLSKLAFKNMSKNIRDYGVYFFTLVLGVSIFYMFNSIYDQKDVMVVTETMNASMIALRKILSIISVFVAVVLGCLIVYANNFFIKRRKKELGIYMILGMNKGKISTILLLETSLMAIVALAFGLALGVLGAQFMSVFTASIFEADMSGFQFVFSTEAAIKSILYFILIFFVVALFNLVLINKYKLIDLLYGNRKNEQMKLKNIWVSSIVFLLSLVCLGVSYATILKNGMVNINGYFLLSIILGTVGTLLFFLSVSSLLTTFVKSNRKLYFKNLNLFVSRQLGSKINTNFTSVSIVCIVLLLVIGIFSSGYSLQNILSSDLKEKASFDFSVFNYYEPDDNIYEFLPAEIKEQDTPHYEFKIYNTGETLHYNDLSSVNDSVMDLLKDSSLDFVLLSDLNELLRMKGEIPISLEKNEYQVLANSEEFLPIAEQLISTKTSILLGETEMKPKATVLSSSLSNRFESIYFIVNDDLQETLRGISESPMRILNINCVNEAQIDSIEHALEQDAEQNSAYTNYISKAGMYESSITTKAIVSFLAIYLGIVFMICCAAILAIQQLSEAADNKERYDLLYKLGADKKMIHKALFTQILCYFLFPLLLAIVHSVVGLTAASQVIRMFGDMHAGFSITVTAVFVIAVYGVYFLLTYMGSKNIIHKD